MALPTLDDTISALRAVLGSQGPLQSDLGRILTYETTLAENVSALASSDEPDVTKATQAVRATANHALNSIAQLTPSTFIKRLASLHAQLTPFLSSTSLHQVVPRELLESVVNAYLRSREHMTRM
jgi:hypothetical protein